MEGHKYLTAHFSDKEKRTVESYWVDDKVKVKKGQQRPVRLSYINVDPKDIHYQNLLKHVTIDELHANTWANIKEQRKAYEESVTRIAESEGIDVKSLAKDQKYDLFFEMIDNSNDMKEEDLFRFKLRLFETPKLSASKDRKKKAELRKANTFKEMVVAYINID